MGDSCTSTEPQKEEKKAESESFKSFPYETMSQTSSVTTSFSSNGSTSPLTPSDSPKQSKKSPRTPSRLSKSSLKESKEAEKEARKEAKRESKEAKKEAKKIAHEEARKRGPNVANLIFDPASPGSTNTSPTSKKSGSSTPRSPSIVLAEDQLPSIANLRRKWSHDKLVNYIIEHNILLKPEDRLAAKAHLADRNTILTFLDKVESVESGGDGPTPEEIAEAEEIGRRKGSPIIKPLDWSKDNFMEVIGLVRKAKGDFANERVEDKEETTPLMEHLDLGAPFRMSVAVKATAGVKTIKDGRISRGTASDIEMEVKGVNAGEIRKNGDGQRTATTKEEPVPGKEAEHEMEDKVEEEERLGLQKATDGRSFRYPRIVSDTASDVHTVCQENYSR